MEGGRARSLNGYPQMRQSPRLAGFVGKDWGRGKLNALLNLMIVIDFFSLEISLEHSLEYPPSAFAQQGDW